MRDVLGDVLFAMLLFQLSRYEHGTDAIADIVFAVIFSVCALIQFGVWIEDRVEHRRRRA